MKKSWWLICLLLVIVNSGWAENLYQLNSLVLDLKADGSFDLVPEGSTAKLGSVKAKLYLYPNSDYRQSLIQLNTTGKVETGTPQTLLFEWNDQKIESKQYSFTSRVSTLDERIAVTQKVAYPLSSLKGFEQYLAASEKIDKDNPLIVAKASELAQGEDDLFKVTFKLARWIEENVAYDLNTLTASTSQKASWVLENKQGVCDEMTSLFIAMCRSLGLPAKFVSGISYSNFEAFTEPWQPHGWAEVYFPGYGWVSFDIAFGEFGYLDVTHIKLREGFDPSEVATKFEWSANQVKLKPKDLDFTVKVVRTGQVNEEDVKLGVSLLSKEIDFNSYNLVKGKVTNLQNYYVGTTLSLAVPSEIELIGNKKKILLLEPRETKEVFWLVKPKNTLSSVYWYEFPVKIYTETNHSAEELFTVSSGKTIYTESEVKALIAEDEDKSYIQTLETACNYSKEIKQNEQKEISCKIKNKGTVNLNSLLFCLDTTCKTTNLFLNQEAELKIPLDSSKPGQHKILVKAENKEINQKKTMEYTVFDPPALTFKVKITEPITYPDKFQLNLTFDKASFSVPENITVLVKSKTFENQARLSQLDQSQFLNLGLDSSNLGTKNKFLVKVTWQDRFGAFYQKEKILEVKVKSKNFLDTFKLGVNYLVSFFY